jgi:hypothetical protein
MEVALEGPLENEEHEGRWAKARNNAEPSTAISPRMRSTFTIRTILRRGAWDLRPSSNPAIEPGQAPIAGKCTKWHAGNKPVQAEASARIVQDEEGLHEDEEDVEPGPFGWVQVETEPEVDYEQHADDAQWPH